ncbi:hypothetical protein IWX46DRAFT_645059 [Phyllosticta citricarpa]|uniref:Uncharacterized protein n=1 Tax=Phyllosticta citricarpa TaxID=55181 RepID=A0ABR1L7C3_9PEZI
MSLAPFNAAIGPIVDLVTVLPPPNQIPPRELPHGCNLDERPPRFTYDPITYFKTATATFTLILDHTTLIPHADGSTETTIAPFKTTIEQPYTETLTKPTDGPSQPSSPSVGKEGVVKERRRGEAPITEVVVVTEWTTVTALDTVTVHLVPSPTLVTQEVTATVYPIPAPLTTERNPPVPRDEHHLAAAAAAAVLEEGTKIALRGSFDNLYRHYHLHYFDSGISPLHVFSDINAVNDHLGHQLCGPTKHVHYIRIRNSIFFDHFILACYHYHDVCECVVVVVVSRHNNNAERDADAKHQQRGGCGWWRQRRGGVGGDHGGAVGPVG